MPPTQTHLFFLGGHDLEMLTIRAMLEREGYPFHDRELSWNNAVLSAYADLFSQDQVNVCIELREDISPPERYLRIDHHNDWSDRPASLIQVAELLQVPLSRHEQLVAANDAGYIPAMEAMGATEAEIAHIRRLDRAAQGVTEAQERQAEQEVAQARQEGKLTVAKTQLSRFSPLGDRLRQTDSLLIFSPLELTYYGVGRNQLVEAYQEEIQAGRAYYGGGEDGFFGLAKGHWTPAEIETEVKRIIRRLR